MRWTSGWCQRPHPSDPLSASEALQLLRTSCANKKPCSVARQYFRARNFSDFIPSGWNNMGMQGVHAYMSSYAMFSCPTTNLWVTVHFHNAGKAEKARWPLGRERMTSTNLFLELFPQKIPSRTVSFQCVKLEFTHKKGLRNLLALLKDWKDTEMNKLMLIDLF